MSKVIWVVGASSGFGFDVTKELLKNGHTVYATARREELMKPLEELGASIGFVDVQDRFTTNTMADRIIKEQGRIDVVINNAGYGYYGPVEQNMSEIKRQFDVNVFGMARVNNAVLPHMRAQKSGRIIMTASLAANVTAGGLGWYSATKHSIKAMAEALRMELRPLKIKVIQIEPGIVKTNFQENAQSEFLKRDYPKEYRPTMNSFYNSQVRRYNSAPGTKTTVKAIVNAVEKANPKFIYRTTWDSKLLSFLKRFVGVKLYTKIVIYLFR